MLRVIPRLEIKGKSFVKGIHLEGIRQIADPDHVAQHYYREGADELFYIDVVASLYDRNSILDIIQRTTSLVHIPVTVAGGLRSVDDMKRALRSGADKVGVNTAFVKNPELIKQATREFGSSTILLLVEAKRQADGTYEAYIDSGREKTGLNVIDWVRRAQDLGVGEICITSIDQEGTQRGLDAKLISSVCSAVEIPVIAHGGFANPKRDGEITKTSLASALALSSLLHVDYIRRFPGELRSPAIVDHYDHFAGLAIGDLKTELVNCGLQCRQEKVN
jgi:cyclase